MDETIRILGTELEDKPTTVSTDLVNATPLRRIVTEAQRDDGVTLIDIDPNELVRMELENGFQMWLRADDLIEDFGHPTVSRSGQQAWEISAIPAGSSERGIIGIGIKVLEFFGVDLKEKTARFVGERYEKKTLHKQGAGLYRVSLDDPMEMTKLSRIPASTSDGPMLIFLHGTASSTAGSFGQLWGDNSEAARERLADLYGKHVYGWEHATLTVSPIQNALELIKCIPKGANIHLVSHSRGGLVGELLCLAQRDRGKSPLRASDIRQLFADDNTLAESLGLPPLDGVASAQWRSDYDEDAKRLNELVGLLDDSRDFQVERFVRVACPAAGTTLASGRLDRWLSVLNLCPLEGWADDLLDFLLAVVKERTDPRSLPGLEAMMPGSALTNLLRAEGLETEADLTVISGDAEGDGIFSKIGMWLTDWFYSSDHDLVVNTNSMYGGIKRPEGRARYRFDQGSHVSHFNYFSNETSVRWLVDGLTRSDHMDAGFQTLRWGDWDLDIARDDVQPSWQAAVERSQQDKAPRPLAIVLPGTMGSELEADGSLVWLEYHKLVTGVLKRLKMFSKKVKPRDALDSFYGPLIETLANTHRVEVFAYDWRLSVRDIALQLTHKLAQLLPRAEAENQPIHLVAHSMGGLVVRAMITDGGQGSQTWERICALEGSRFLMLGTPNRGSFEAVRWLMGMNKTQALLALVDLTQSTKDIINLVNKFPGMLELLPSADDRWDFNKPATLKRLREWVNGRWSDPDVMDLKEAAETWRQLKTYKPDLDRTLYVAGHQPRTVSGFDLLEPKRGRWSRKRRVRFRAVSEGDGTVTWSSGILEGVQTWYAEDTSHEELCSKENLLPAYLDLLFTGDTERLSKSPPVASRAGMAGPREFYLPDLPPADSIPTSQDIRQLSFGIGRPSQGEQVEHGKLKVRIIHGDLAYMENAVAVGHYQGDSLINAEAAMDERLGSVLSERMNLGLYPGPLGTCALLPGRGGRFAPAAALVVGLGVAGDLTPAALEVSMRRALVEFALGVASWPDGRFGEINTPVRSAKITCLLVGSGPGGIEVRESVEAILRAALRAAEDLTEAGKNTRVTLDEIDFVELYEDTAMAAASALRDLVESNIFQGRLIWPEQIILKRPGHRRRVMMEEAPGWWHRLAIREDREKGVLIFESTTGKARIEVLTDTGQLTSADMFIRQACGSTATSKVAQTLFEMLMPNRLKENSPNASNRVLLVDTDSARFPWELLEDRWASSGRPLAVSSGLVRQLRTPVFRQHVKVASADSALIVGNPYLPESSKFAELPGARKEAGVVSNRLRAQGFKVSEKIDAPAGEIMEALHESPWRILHLAGHGVHNHPLVQETDDQTYAAPEKKPKTVSGMVIGEGTILTPRDVAQMRYVPELVFINCCHLGKVDGDKAYNRLAANLGIEFIRMGVKAVLAAGWAVNDRAAIAFAEEFYSWLLRGSTFGEAVRLAREFTWRSYPSYNTWGAYQCYGDPGYRLRKGSGADLPSKKPTYLDPSEYVVELENFTEMVRVKSRKPAAQDSEKTHEDFTGELINLMKRVDPNLRSDWEARADVCAALGFAWGELSEWKKGLEWLEKAISAAEGDCPVRVIEQSANWRARWALQQWRDIQANCGDSEEDKAHAEEQRQELESEIEKTTIELDILAQRAASSERLSLIGACYKRLACVATVPRRRIEALLSMSNSYQKAYEFSSDSYPLVNWAMAAALVWQLDEESDESSRKQLMSACNSLVSSEQERTQGDKDFRQAVLMPDCELALLLGQKKLNKAKCETLIQSVLKGYVDAAGRGVSQRQVSSLLENVDFVSEMLSTEGCRAPRYLRNAMANLKSGISVFEGGRNYG